MPISHPRRILGATVLAIALIVPALTTAQATPRIPAGPAAAGPANTSSDTVIDAPAARLAAGEHHGIRTWTHDKASKATKGAVAHDEVRQSPFYSVRVAPASAPEQTQDSFTYLSVPRNGEGKKGYSAEDGADFAASTDATMSWSTFEYSPEVKEVFVYVTLLNGKAIDDPSQVTVRPTSVEKKNIKVEAIEDGGRTAKIRVPYSSDGYRLSVEFSTQAVSTYADKNGALSQDGEGTDSKTFLEAEPRNAMLLFAQPQAPQDTVPDAGAPEVLNVRPGDISNLDAVAGADSSKRTLFFGPGVYSMGSAHLPQLPSNISRVYLAPGAFVKGGFHFADNKNTTEFQVAGYGVLSGEEYAYEADTLDGFRSFLDPKHPEYRDTKKKNKADCHSDCAKPLRFSSSSGTAQHLTLQGVTVKEPPFHSFVVYGDESTFRMDVSNYQQVGAWYWQTDGLEMYSNPKEGRSTLKNSFFHANDDVFKLYHSNVDLTNNVVWKNQNGPVFQWGWKPRNVDKVNVTGTDIIHSRMFSRDVAQNTCVFNSAKHWDPKMASRTDLADPSTTVSNLTFTDTRVEGSVNCAIRVYALSNTENITINGLSLDGWNGQNTNLTQSRIELLTNSAGQRVRFGSADGVTKGLTLRRYQVGQGGGATGAKPTSYTNVTIDNNEWQSDKPGRLNFDADLWGRWTATEQ